MHLTVKFVVEIDPLEHRKSQIRRRAIDVAEVPPPVAVGLRDVESFLEDGDGANGYVYMYTHM